MLRDDIKEFKKLDFSVEERMLLNDLLQGDAWQVLQKITDHMFMSLFISMLAAPTGAKGEGFERGSFYGLASFLDCIEKAAKPPEH